VHDNGGQGELCPNAAFNAGYSAWNEEFVRYPNRCGDAGCDLAVVTCYGVTGATGTTNKPAEYNGGHCIAPLGVGCRDTSYRRSSESAQEGAGVATDAETVTVTTTQCSDGISNDSDGLIDMADSGCTDPGDTTEDPNAVTATLTNNGPIISGQSAMLTWSSTGATSCSSTSFATGGATGGSVSTGVLTNPPQPSYPYSVNCSGAVANTTVLLTNPTAYIEANPDRVNVDATTLLSFSAAGLTPASSCTVTGPTGTLWTGSSDGAGALATTTSTSPKITQQSTFRISCDGATATDNVIVNLVPQFEEF